MPATRSKRRQGRGSWTQIATPSSNSYTDYTGMLGTEYTYRARAVVSGTNKSWSNEVEIAFGFVDTTQVEGLTATEGQGKIDLSWDRPTGTQQLKEYKIEVATTSGGSFADLATTTGTTYTHSALGDGVSRWYRVAAVDAADVRGTWSETATATTLPPQVDTTKVEGLTATGGRRKIDLSWDRPSGTQQLKEYKIEVATTSGGSFSDLATTNGTTTTYTHSGLEHGASRWYRVAAVDTADARGTWSDTETATTDQGLTPSAPRTVEATAVFSSIWVTWRKPTDEGATTVSGYRIERTVNGGCGDAGAT